MAINIHSFFLSKMVARFFGSSVTDIICIAYRRLRGFITLCTIITKLESISSLVNRRIHDIFISNHKLYNKIVIIKYYRDNKY